MQIAEKIRNEPVALAGGARLVALLAAAFGFDLAEGETVGIVLGVAALVDLVWTVIVRNRVSPVPKAPKAPRLPMLALVLACFVAAPVLSGCSALSAALPVIAAAAPVIQTILTQVEKADAVARHNLPKLAALYPDFPAEQAEAEYVRAFTAVQSAATAALEAAKAADAADDENLAAAMAHLRRALRRLHGVASQVPLDGRRRAAHARRRVAAQRGAGARGLVVPGGVMAHRIEFLRPIQNVCGGCNGTGRIQFVTYAGGVEYTYERTCASCGGSGQSPITSTTGSIRFW